MESPKQITCPWCGERFSTFIDPAIAEQTYIEDCQVCCRPIELHVEQWGSYFDFSVTTERS